MPSPKGQSKKRLTNTEREEVTILVSKLLSMGKTKGEVKRMISNQYGIQRRTVENYIRRAREEMREETGKPIDDLRSDAHHFYLSILNDPEATFRDKIRARERIDKLLGLDRPVLIHNKNTNLELTPEQIQEMTDDELADLQSRITNSD